MKRHFLLLAGCLFFADSSAQAWNGFGHRESAAVAWEKLTPVAKKEATRLLKINPQYALWIKGVPRGPARPVYLHSGSDLAGSDQVAEGLQA